MLRASNNLVLNNEKTHSEHSVAQALEQFNIREHIHVFKHSVSRNVVTQVVLRPSICWIKSDYILSEIQLLADHHEDFRAVYSTDIKGIKILLFPVLGIHLLSGMVAIKMTPDSEGANLLIDIHQSLQTAHIRHTSLALERFKRLAKLTSRDIKILQYLAKGDSNLEIANRLNLSKYTINICIDHIVSQMSLTSRYQACLLGMIYS